MKKKKKLRKNIFGNCEMESLIEKYKKKILVRVENF